MALAAHHSLSFTKSALASVTSVFSTSTALSERTSSDPSKLSESNSGVGTPADGDSTDASTTRPFVWLGNLVPNFFNRKQRRRRLRTDFQDHAMSTRSKSRLDRAGSVFTHDDITEHDYDENQQEYHDHLFYTIITRTVETVCDIAFEVEEFGRKLVGAESRREERERAKLIWMEPRADLDVHDTPTRRSNIDSPLPAEEPYDGLGFWCCLLLPLVLLAATLAVLTGECRDRFLIST